MMVLLVLSRIKHQILPSSWTLPLFGTKQEEFVQVKRCFCCKRTADFCLTESAKSISLHV